MKQAPRVESRRSDARRSTRESRTVIVRLMTPAWASVYLAQRYAAAVKRQSRC
jgi:hypothetical protein